MDPEYFVLGCLIGLVIAVAFTLTRKIDAMAGSIRDIRQANDDLEAIAAQLEASTAKENQS